MIDFCDYCGRDSGDCVCQYAPDFPDEPDLEIDTDFLDWDFDEEKDDEDSGQEDHGQAKPD